MQKYFTFKALIPKDSLGWSDLWKKAAMEKRAKTCWVGPQILYFPPALKSGDVRVAHLAKVTVDNTTGSVYAPQTYQYSFELEKEKRKYRK